VFIGHGHFDHAADIGAILDGSGATVVGTPEHCAFAHTQVSAGTDVRCVAASPAAAALGTRTEVELWTDVRITALVHPHSARESRDASDPHAPVVPVPGVDTMVLHPADPADSMVLAEHAGDAEGGTVLYQFRLRDFSLTWHDSTGPLPELAPDLFATSRLAPTDVEVGAIVGFNQYANGMRDPRLYVEALHPKVFVPAHHDNWLPPVTGHASEYEAALRAELATLEPASQPEIRFLYDPTDYLRPSVLTFSWRDRLWRES
jgi:L-ascorbate metabolism protein UlaG (beta-lactamase superfamily)